MNLHRSSGRDRQFEIGQVKALLGVSLDIERMEFGPDGVVPFLWPVPRTQVEDVREAFLSMLECVGQESADDPNAHLMEIVNLQWAMSVVRSFQASALLARFRKQGATAGLSPRNDFTWPLSRGNALPVERYLTWLTDGPPAPHLMRAVASEVRNRLRRDDIRFRSFWNASMRRGIVTCATGPLISAQAQNVTEPVYYLPHAVWFGVIDRRDLAAAETACAQLAERAVGAAQRAFETGGEELSLEIRSWLNEQFRQSLAALAIHYEWLLGRPARLPNRLWTGANGNAYTRLLRRAVRKFGGTVVAHDHGTGAGIFVNSTIPRLELIDCDRFVAFSGAQANVLRAYAHADGSRAAGHPEIVVAPANYRFETTLRPPRVLGVGKERAGLNKRILYIDPRFYGDRGHLIAWRSDIVVMDWIVRLVEHLKEWGCEVIYKAHPETPAKLPRYVREHLGIEVVEDSFEKMRVDFDVILFDDPHSSTLPMSLVSDKDVVLIDVGFMKWGAGAKDLLRCRCPIVDSWFDADNRQQVDWDELHQALKIAPLHRDDGFVQAFWRVSAPLTHKK